jgi:hypothetical protein
MSEENAPSRRATEPVTLKPSDSAEATTLPPGTTADGPAGAAHADQINSGAPA